MSREETPQREVLVDACGCERTPPPSTGGGEVEEPVTRLWHVREIRLGLLSGALLGVGFLAGLGLVPVGQEMAGHEIGGRIPSDPTGATSVPGVWVAGNVTTLTDQVIAAAAAGVRAGAAVNADLVAEETRRAVAARREAASVFSAPSEREVCDRVLGDRRHGV